MSELNSGSDFSDSEPEIQCGQTQKEEIAQNGTKKTTTKVVKRKLSHTTSNLQDSSDEEVMEVPVRKKLIENSPIATKKEEIKQDQPHSQVQDPILVEVEKEKDKKENSQAKKVFGIMLRYSEIKELVWNESNLLLSELQPKILRAMKLVGRPQWQWMIEFLDMYEEQWTKEYNSVCVLQWDIIKRVFQHCEENLSHPLLTRDQIKDMIRCLHISLKKHINEISSLQYTTEMEIEPTGTLSMIASGKTTAVNALQSMFGDVFGTSAGMQTTQIQPHMLPPCSSIQMRGPEVCKSYKLEQSTGSQLIEIKVYNSKDVTGVPFQRRWEKSLINAKIVCGGTDPMFVATMELVQRHLSNMVKSGAREKSFPTNSQNLF